MNESGTRKPFRIISEDLAENRPKWRVRTDDGQVRGPLSDNGLKALEDVGILTETATICGENSETWLPISEQSVWAEIKQSKTKASSKKLALTGSRPPMPMPQGYSAAESVPPMLNMAERRAHAAFVEQEKTYRTFRILRIAKSVRVVRELLVLGLFLAVGDLCISCFDETLGAAKWLIAFCVIVTALMYYIFQALQD